MRTHSLPRSVSAGLIAAFSVLGVMVYAFGDDETLAGPAVAFFEELDSKPDFGFCPPNFPIESPASPTSRVDDNGDGTVCTDDKGHRFVDNDFFIEEKGPSQVTGHGNFVDGGKVLQAQDISFSFVGISTGDGSKGFSDTAKGEFEYHDQTPAGPDLTVHGDVVCLSVVGNTATLVGRVTNSNDFSLPVDSVVAWMTQDNGEGINDPADLVSRPSPIGSKLPKESCKISLPKLKLVLISTGNIQVH